MTTTLADCGTELIIAIKMLMVQAPKHSATKQIAK
jgi:hypothetical protein